MSFQPASCQQTASQKPRFGKHQQKWDFLKADAQKTDSNIFSTEAGKWPTCVKHRAARPETLQLAHLGTEQHEAHSRALPSYHFDLPVDVPLLHVAESPRFDGVARAGVHPNQPVVGNADQLLLLAPLEPAARGGISNHRANGELNVLNPATQLLDLTRLLIYTI